MVLTENMEIRGAWEEKKGRGNIFKEHKVPS